MELFIQYRQSRIFCRKTGTGPELVFCFHGYGECCDTFNALAASLEQTHTVYAFDLPLHGNTIWNEGPTCTPDMWQEILQQCNPEQRPVTLLGYSIGGRIALAMYQRYPDSYKKLVLIAPDGLHVNFWYWFSTQTRIGNRIFKHTVEKPGWIFALVGIAYKTRLVNKAMYKIAHHYIDDAAQRKHLYARWTVLRRFTPRLSAIQAAIQTRGTAVRMLFGKYDNVIPSRNGYKFAAPIPEQAVMEVAVAGHQLLKDKHLPLITRLVVE